MFDSFLTFLQLTKINLIMMKKYITVAALLAAGTAFANAAPDRPQTLTWTGGEGTFTVNQAKQASNWDGVTPTLDSGSLYGVYTFATGGNITIGSSEDLWGGMYTSDGGSWTVSNDTNVVLYGKNANTWTGNITVDAGSSLTINHSSLQLKDGNYEIHGNLTIGWDVKFDSGAGKQSFDLGTDGTFSTDSRMYTGGKTIVFSGDVDLGAGASYVLKTRVLFDGVGQINGDGTQVASISALFNNSITADFEGLDTYDASLSLSTAALTAEDMGKYFLSTDGTNIVLNYVSAVPEPSAFGLLAGLGALALVASRRRRK